MLFSTTEKRYEQCFVPAVSVLAYDFWNTAVAFEMKMLTLNNSKGQAVLSYYTVLMMFKSGMLITKRFKNFVIL